MHIFFNINYFCEYFLSILPFFLDIVRRDASHFHDVQLVIIYFMDYAFSVVLKTQHHTQYYLNFSAKLFSGRLIILFSCGWMYNPL